MDSATVPTAPHEIVLITGGNGFLGQHLVRILQERDPLVKEIRVLDLMPYEQKLDYVGDKEVVSFVGDICAADTTIDDAFRGVHCVFHCAALNCLQFPPDFDGLTRVNVRGTQNVIQLCVKYNVARLVYTSSSTVTLIPYMGRATFSMIINQTESKAKTPVDDNGFLIPGFPASKLRAEKIVLGSNGLLLANGKGILRTLALRPTPMYGEADSFFMPTVVRVAQHFGGQVPKISGKGGKQQMTYAGNVAWAHICAKDTLKMDLRKVSGLPVLITDDTACVDITRFCQRLTASCTTLKLRPSWWSIPTFVTYFLAMLLELIMTGIVHPLFGVRLPLSPRGISSYTSSLIMYSRLRASIDLDYDPVYTEDKALLNSSLWYDKWYGQYLVARRRGAIKTPKETT